MSLQRHTYWDTPPFGGVLLLVVAVCMSLAAFYAPGYPGDISDWLERIQLATSLGPIEGFQAVRDVYPPLTTCVLWWSGYIANAFNLSPIIGYKICIFIFLQLTTLSFLLLTRNVTLSALLQLTLIPNSLLIAGPDVFFAPTMLMSFWALQQGRTHLFTALFAVTLFIKWIPLIILPFIVAYCLGLQTLLPATRKQWADLARLVACPLVVACLMYLTFGQVTLRSLGYSVVNNYLSGDALNFMWLVGAAVQYVEAGKIIGTHLRCIMLHDITLLTLLKIPFFIYYALLYLRFLREEKTLWKLTQYSAVASFTYFALCVGVHENHSFLLCLLAFLMFAQTRADLWLLIYVVIFTNLNILIFDGLDGQGLPWQRGPFIDVTVPLALVNMLYFLYLYLTVIMNWRMQSRPEFARRGAEQY